jgi:hypothetical protein
LRNIRRSRAAIIVPWVLRLSLAAMGCTTVIGCGPSAAQRDATITFGRALQAHGELVANETIYIRSEIKTMRVLTISLPGARSAALFNQGAYKNPASGLPEPRIQRMVQIGGAAGNFGKSLAQVADLASTTADEKIFSAATRELFLTAGAIGNAASGVTVGAPAVNLLTFLSTQHYRLKYLEQALPAAEPAFRAADKDVSAEFDPESPDSLIDAFVAAVDQLEAMLEASRRPTSATTSAQDREIVANSYRVVARNRDHIKYVTSRELELMNKSGAAFDAVTEAYQGNSTQLDAVDNYSTAVLEVSLAFQSLR